MIIAVDIGNSDVVLGLVKDSKILQSWRIHTGIHQSVDEYEILVRGMLFACEGPKDEVRIVSRDRDWRVSQESVA